MKLYVAARRPVIAPAPQAEFFDRFEALPGAQAQVDWGDEGTIDTATGPLAVYSFHMTLSYSRDPFCCFVASQDLATFYDCHRRAFAHYDPRVTTLPRNNAWLYDLLQHDQQAVDFWATKFATLREGTASQRRNMAKRRRGIRKIRAPREISGSEQIVKRGEQCLFGLQAA